jgi:hypothetical protein
MSSVVALTNMLSALTDIDIEFDQFKPPITNTVDIRSIYTLSLW